VKHTNPNLLLFVPLASAWLYVAFHFARNFWRRRNYVSLMLAFMPLGYLGSALRELHLLNLFSAEILYSGSLVVGCLTAFVVWENNKHRGPTRGTDS
jgi:hypothetical protein